ncbi:MAG TPA: GDP-L-fucose synthase, partial [Pedobacter sp.]|nr:GDP-L-fucose synthase [Pedobacter sp.]
GMVGSAIVRKLEQLGYTNIITRTSKQLDLCNQQAVNQFFLDEKPAYVFLAAAKVGGIQANNEYRADFLLNNLLIQANVIEASKVHSVKKLLFLGSSCIYPKLAAQPIKESCLLAGHLEPTNEPYAIAKIAGIKLCEAFRDQYGCNFISVMPTNLYGPNDNYDLNSSHVLPALIRKFHEAMAEGRKEVVLWGSGKPKREFLYVDDLAEACVFLMKFYNQREILNIGTGKDISISELGMLIADIVGFKGTIVQDESKPDGCPRKLLDVTKINQLGWTYKTDIKKGIMLAYGNFLQNKTHWQTA